MASQPSTTTRAGESAVRRYFEKPERYLRNDFGVRIRADIVGELARALPPGDVLDAGCGDGRVSAPLLADGRRVTFLDASQPMLDRAKRGVPPELAVAATFVHGTLETMGGEPRFALVLLMGVLAHVDSVDGALARAASLTAKGGTLLVQLTDGASLVGRTNYAYHRLRERLAPTRGYLLNRLDVAGVVASAARADLALRRVHRYSFVLPGMMKLPDPLLYELTSLSRRWPLRALGGEAIVELEKR